MTKRMVRVLVVDDYEPWHSFYLKELGKRTDLQIVANVSDGLDAIRQAQELQPDLILLDIGLPRLNGIKAAAEYMNSAPRPKFYL